MFQELSITSVFDPEEETTFKPLPVVVEEKTTFRQLPVTTERARIISKPEFEEAPFEARHPNIYGAWGATKETGKALIPYLKYVDPSERKEFMKLSKQKQVRALLLQNLEAVAMVGAKPIAEGTKLVFAAKLPKTFARLSKMNRFGKAPKAITPAEKVAPAASEEAVAARPKMKSELKGIYDEVFDDLPPHIQKDIRVETVRIAKFPMEDAGTGGRVEITGSMREPQKYHVFLEKGEPVKETLRHELLHTYVLEHPELTTGKGYFGHEKAIEVLEKTIAKKTLSAKVATEPLPKYAGSVNLERQAISDQAKRLELEMFERHGVKSPLSRKVMVEKAKGFIDDFQKNPDKYAKRVEAIKAGQTPTIEEELAHRMMNAEGYDDFVRVIQSGDSAKIEAMEQAIKTQHLSVTNPLAEKAGQRLGMYNIEVGKHRALKAIAELKKKLNPRQLKELGELDTTDADAVRNFVKRLPDPKLRDYFYEFWYNSILSGIPTHVVNVASNTAWMAFQPTIHRPLVGAVDAILSTFTGRARTRYMNEVIPMLAGMKTGAKRGAKGAWQMLRTGKVEKFETKWAQEIGASLGAFDRSPSKIVRGVGKFITPPTKALRAMDVMANSIGYEAQLRAVARRSANLKGLKGQARKVFESNLLKNPTEAMHKEAMEFGKYVTFMSDPGWVSSGIISARKKIPLESGRLVVPFVNTIGNLLKRGVEMTPGIGLTLARKQNPSEVIAKQIEGAVVALYVSNKFDAGELTGAAPRDPAKRAAFYRQGKKAWSIRFGNTWIQYRRVEPFNTIIATVASLRERIATAKDDETKTEIFMGVANDMKNNLIDSSYMQGVTSILNRHGKAKGAVQRFGASLVPYSGFWRSINRAYEVKTEGSAKVRDTSSWMGALSQTIPFIKKPPPKLTIWGDEIELEGGMFRQWLPYKWSTEKMDTTERFLQKLDRYPGMPSQTFKYRGKPMKLDDDIYRDMIIFGGHRAKKILDARTGSKIWQRAVKDEKRHPILIRSINNIIKTQFDHARSRAIRRQLGK